MLTKPLEEVEKLDRRDVEGNMVLRMATFKLTLEEVFPGNGLCNIGLKLRGIGKNIFVNEFLYNILADVPSCAGQMVMREHLILNDENQMDAKFIQPKTIDLNCLFVT